MNKMDRLKWEWEEYLFLISRSFMGWPAQRNRWLYPDIFLWDEDENGDNIIPGLIAFYMNPITPITMRDRHDFKFHLMRSVPGPWDLHWLMLDNICWANRTTYGWAEYVPEYDHSPNGGNGHDPSHLRNRDEGISESGGD